MPFVIPNIHYGISLFMFGICYSHLVFRYSYALLEVCFSSSTFSCCNE